MAVVNINLSIFNGQENLSLPGSRRLNDLCANCCFCCVKPVEEKLSELSHYLLFQKWMFVCVFFLFCVQKSTPICFHSSEMFIIVVFFRFINLIEELHVEFIWFWYWCEGLISCLRGLSCLLLYCFMFHSSCNNTVDRLAAANPAMTPWVDCQWSEISSSISANPSFFCCASKIT